MFGDNFVPMSFDDYVRAVVKNIENGLDVVCLDAAFADVQWLKQQVPLLEGDSLELPPSCDTISVGKKLIGVSASATGRNMTDRFLVQRYLSVEDVVYAYSDVAEFILNNDETAKVLTETVKRKTVLGWEVGGKTVEREEQSKKISASVKNEVARAQRRWHTSRLEMQQHEYKIERRIERARHAALMRDRFIEHCGLVPVKRDFYAKEVFKEIMRGKPLLISDAHSKSAMMPTRHTNTPVRNIPDGMSVVIFPDHGSLDVNSVGDKPTEFTTLLSADGVTCPLDIALDLVNKYTGVEAYFKQGDCTAHAVVSAVAPWSEYTSRPWSDELYLDPSNDAAIEYVLELNGPLRGDIPESIMAVALTLHQNPAKPRVIGNRINLEPRN